MVIFCYNVLIVLRDGVDLILPVGIFDDSITLHNRQEKTNCPIINIEHMVAIWSAKTFKTAK